MIRKNQVFGWYRVLALLIPGLLFASVSVAPNSAVTLPMNPRTLSVRGEAAEFQEVIQRLKVSRYLDFVQRYSRTFNVDFRLVLALMKQESQFRHESLSERGAVGLMQIMPATGSRLSTEIEISDINHPDDNIRAGIYYLSSLLELFSGARDDDRIRLALAAYNAGPGRVYDAQELAAYMGENPNTWKAVKSSLPLLSKRFYSLHSSVWTEGHPRNGNFGSWKQTVEYVEKIMTTYESYRQIPR